MLAVGLLSGAAMGAEVTGGAPTPTEPVATTLSPTVPTTPAASPLPVSITTEPLLAGRPIPPRFLGLSFEAEALDQIGQLGAHGDLVTLLRSLGPGLLRFGGITADENVAWSDPQTPHPAWATSTIGPAQMKAIGRLARSSGWQVLLTVGLAHFEPQAAAREVASAHAALGPYLAAVEIGNEADAYGRHGFRPEPWLAQGYQEDVSVYREAIAKLTPGIRIAGPDVSGSGAFPEWGYAEAVAQTPALLTGHHYPLGCAQTPPPSIESLLSAAIRGREAHSLETYLSISRAHNIPFRVDETNSVSCGGVAGISDTFASALWATGYIAQAMAAGTVGINLQGNPTNCAGYTPLCAPDPAALSAGQMRAQPDWYALLLMHSLIGYRPLPTSIGSTVSPNLVAAAFAGPGDSLKLLVSDDEAPGASPLEISLPAGAGRRAARVLRLTGPSLPSTDGTRLGGKGVSASGAWHAPLVAQDLPIHGGIVSLRLPASSAALVTVVPVKKKVARKRSSHRSR
ncbi:MAG TPA: glycosyl hydrolase family 79 C-terminal domain-containing protein [Solirubrobacteraceae bacterium]|nr:glycosyl hydrolase family 79 C-terminal domain-containing protein [Solirubrobacteraceae bacterium]